MAHNKPQTVGEVQAEQDKAEIKVKVINNGILVKAGEGWFTFKTWDEASIHIGHRITAVIALRVKS